MTDLTLPLEGLSSVNGKSVIARFDGGTLSSALSHKNQLLFPPTDGSLKE